MSTKFFLLNDIDLKVKVKINALEHVQRLIPRSFDGPEFLHIAIQVTLCASKIELFPSLQSLTKTFVFGDNERDLFWDEWFTFDLAYKDLPLSSCLVVSIWDVSRVDAPRILGGSTFALFGKKLTLRRGEQRLLIWPGVKGDRSTRQCATPHVIGERDERARLELFRKRHQRKQVVHIKWLDELMRKQVAAVEQDLKQSDTQRSFLRISVPEFELPVLFYQPLYRDAVDYGERLVNDPEMTLPNPVEQAHLKISRGDRLARADRELKPLTSELAQLNTILGYPPTQELDASEKQLVWRFRYHLATQARALTKFLRIVDWSDESEAERALELMQQWAPIDHADAIELLGKAFTHTAVRRYAVQRLASASDDELCSYLLQLVQAFNYELGSVPEVTSSPLVEFVVHRAVRSVKLTNFLQWYLWVEANDATDSRRKMYADVLLYFRNHLNEALLTDLIMSAGRDREAKLRSSGGGGGGESDADANDVELDVQSSSALLAPRRPSSEAESARAPSPAPSSDNNNNAKLWSDAMSATSDVSVARRMKGVFTRQKKLMKRISEMASDLRNLKMSRPKKREKLREWIGKGKYELDQFEPVPLPLDPDVQVCGIRAASANVFKSAMQPLGLEFKTVGGGSYSVLFKSGDDLRQDQFVVEMIRLMDRVLKREQLDLQLTPYAVLATSADEGLVQLIPSRSVADVLRSANIGAFLKQCTGADPLDAYVKSCAGYSVITYILGIGDRHLDNLLMVDDGRLFHIDFGFILGRDPKPYPPPMKISKEMVEGMGGSASPQYQQFKSYCCEAFNLLRKQASLLLNLFSLMLDSSVPDIVSEGDRAVLRVQEKLRLELTPEEAEVAFQQLINESVGALFPAFIENLHRAAQYMRS